MKKKTFQSCLGNGYTYSKQSPFKYEEWNFFVRCGVSSPSQFFFKTSICIEIRTIHWVKLQFYQHAAWCDVAENRFIATLCPYDLHSYVFHKLFATNRFPDFIEWMKWDQNLAIACSIHCEQMCERFFRFRFHAWLETMCADVSSWWLPPIQFSPMAQRLLLRFVAVFLFR